MINQQLNNPPNIIGISGKINCGKDLVGKIIQYLTTTNEYVLKNKPTFEDWMNNYSHHSNWEIKKFADKLKDIVCLLIGCTREQLEDREFKEKELGEEWRKWIVYQFSEYSNFIPSDLVFNTEQECCEYINNITDNKRIFTYKSEILTPRMLLQQIGTDLFRNQLHPNVWVNATMTDYKIKYFISDVDELGCEETVTTKEFPVYPNWIITDVRFPNEADAIKDREGIIIRVNRSLESQVIISAKEKYNIDVSNALIKETFNELRKFEHPSESALDNYKFDYVINNNGTINNLVDKVKEILIKENKLLIN